MSTSEVRHTPVGISHREPAAACGIDLHNPFLDAAVTVTVLRTPLGRYPPPHPRGDGRGTRSAWGRCAAHVIWRACGQLALARPGPHAARAGRRARRDQEC